MGRNNLNPSGLSQKDIEGLNAKFNHGKTLLTSGIQKEESVRSNNKPDDLRSVRSEYDYGAKKKFVDVLGEPKK